MTRGGSSDNYPGKVCYTYMSIIDTMLTIASQSGVDLQTFFELMSESPIVRADVGAIVVQIDERGANAVLDDDDINLGKQLFGDMEQVADHLEGLNPGDPTYLYDAAGYITAETAAGMLFTYDSMGTGSCW